MKRRRPVIAIAIAAMVLVTVGLGAYRGESRSTHQDRCENLDELFEGYCKPGLEMSSCATVTDEYGEACQAGCVLGLCPEKVSCTEPDSLWCASCEDMKGARFWSDVDRYGSRCSEKLRVGLQAGPRAEWDACLESAMEEHCPALTGTDWFSRFHAALGR